MVQAVLNMQSIDIDNGSPRATYDEMYLVIKNWWSIGDHGWKKENVSNRFAGELNNF